MSKARETAEIAAAVALAVILHFIKIYTMPQGGDISLTMVPLIFIAHRRGLGAGVTAGILYGIINVMLDGAIYHPMSILLDYICAFGVLGIAGVFPKKISGIICGTVTAVACRFLFSFLSGAVLFGSYAPDGINPWLYSFVYQATYLVPELIICLAATVTVYVKFKNK